MNLGLTDLLRNDYPADVIIEVIRGYVEEGSNISAETIIQIVEKTLLRPNNSSN